MLMTIPERIAAIQPTPRQVTAAQAANELTACSGMIIDVREPAEYEANKANNTVNIPRGLLEMKILGLANDPQTPIYLHCASGARAMLSAEQLTILGYERVAVITCDVATIQRVFAVQ